MIKLIKDLEDPTEGPEENPLTDNLMVGKGLVTLDQTDVMKIFRMDQKIVLLAINLIEEISIIIITAKYIPIKMTGIIKDMMEGVKEEIQKTIIWRAMKINKEAILLREIMKEEIFITIQEISLAIEIVIITMECEIITIEEIIMIEKTIFTEKMIK